MREVTVHLTLITLVLVGLTVLMGLWRLDDISAEEAQVQELETIADHIQQIEAFAKFTTGGPWFRGQDVPGPILGSTAAPVHIVEFGDYQCEFCAVVVDSLAEMVRHSEGRVKLSFVHRPSRDSVTRPHSRTAALGGICAHKTGDFWSYHEAVYRDQQRLAEDGASFVTHILEAAVGMDDVAAATRCLASPETKSGLEQHLDLAQRLLVRSTPTFFVNGRRFAGTNMDLLRAAAGFELRRTSAETTSP